ncbi:MAG: RdgB/HAM1 family non-canonical purine NTP pyrophosphatase [Actinomycetota bacterium]|jgi:XTP/dITP diphosphohydrolase
MKTFVLATANAHKVDEIREILADLNLVLLNRPSDVPEVVEDGETLEDNALLKARALVAATGHAAIADDTGLFVDALGGAPGVHSARYAGSGATDADNVRKLLDALRGLDATERGAHFRTVAAVAYPDDSWFVVSGEVSGTITEVPRGDQGFGYDPIFAPQGLRGRTLAELSSSEKHALSHRGNAFRELVDALRLR